MSGFKIDDRSDRNLAYCLLRSANIPPKSGLEQALQYVEKDKEYASPLSMGVLVYLRETEYRMQISAKLIAPFPELIFNLPEILAKPRKSRILEAAAQQASGEPDRSVAIVVPSSVLRAAGCGMAIMVTTIANPVSISVNSGAWKIVMDDPTGTLGGKRAFCILPFSSYLGLEDKHE